MARRTTIIGETGLLPFLTAYWTADNIPTDVHTNSLGGAWVGAGGANYTVGINNNCFDFGNNATVRYIEIPDNNLLSFTDGVNDLPFSISFWFNAYLLQTGTFGWVFTKRPNSSQEEYQIVVQVNTIGFTKFSNLSNSNFLNESVTVALSNNVWYHAVITSDGTKLGDKVYLNGNLLAWTSQTENGTYVKMANGTSAVRVGTGFGKFRGRIDEIALFRDYELSQAQITDLYNGGAGKFYPNI